MGIAEDLLRDAWALTYLDVPRAQDAAARALALAEPDSAAAAWALWHLALAGIRSGDADAARAHNTRAAEVFARLGLARGELLALEVEAIALRRAGKPEAARELQQRIDAAGDPGYEAMDRFVAHNSRAITAKLLGDTDGALAHFYDALDAADRAGHAGAQITALANLGGFHQDLFNLDDARALSERALDAARSAGARAVVTTSAANLIVIHCAAGQHAEALAMARFLVDHPHEQLPQALERVPLALALAFLNSGRLEDARAWLERGAVVQIGDGDGAGFWAWVSARLKLAEGDAAGARDVAERVLREHGPSLTLPYDRMELLRAAADAAQAQGDLAAALAHTKDAHAVYEHLVGRSARARYRALQATHEFAQAQRQREAVEIDRRRLADLNRALEAKVAETELLHAQLRDQALRDPLTGLHNRRYLFEVGPGLVELARRQRATLSVVLLDLDHFKRINDSHGHAAGDEALRRTAALLARELRRSDVLCRHGGEEFVIVMPDVDTATAHATMQRLLAELRAEVIVHRQRRLPACSFSAGVATFPAHGDTLEQLLGRADKALYAAKSGGRSRVEAVSDSGFATLP
jgi:diguanylate cyclase (GGDEF)-like protein